MITRSKLLSHPNLTLFLLILPGLVWFFFLRYLPLAGILLAFKQFHYARGGFFNSFSHSPWVGWDNFRYLFNSPAMWQITRNTILYNLAFIVVGTFFSLALAIALQHLYNRGLAKLYQTCLMLPYFLSWVVVGYLLLSYLSVDKGSVNAWIKYFGGKPVQWYDQTLVWPYLLILVNTWKNAGYTAIVYLAAIVGIDQQYYEAAALDGASKWQQIWYVTIPHLKPLIIIMTLLALGRIFAADFGLFYQVPLNSGSLYSVTDVIDTYVFRSLIKTGDIGMASAAGLYQSVIGFILLLVVNHSVRKFDRESALF